MIVIRNALRKWANFSSIYGDTLDAKTESAFFSFASKSSESGKLAALGARGVFRVDWAIKSVARARRVQTPLRESLLLKRRVWTESS
jgi:hypothetical protein